MTVREAIEGVFIVAGCTCLLTVMARDMGYKEAKLTQVAQECPKLDRVRTYSTIELQRLVAARKRMERVKP